LMPESFDDEQADVPVGAAEPVERVVVVGAGDRRIDGGERSGPWRG
jgi:hypothetical protein